MEPDRGGRGAGLAAVVLAVTAFSWGFILVKSIELPPPVLAFWRVLAGATVLTCAAFALRVPWPRRFGMVLLAGLAFGAHQLLYIAATKLTSVAIVTTIGATQPLFVMMVSQRLLTERVAPRLFLFGAIAAGGIGLVVLGSIGDISRSTTGDLLAVANVGVFTAYFLAAKRARMDGARTLTFTAAFLLCALPVVASAMLLWSGPAAPSTGTQIGLLAVLALGPGNGHLLLNWAHPRVSAALSSLVLASVPMLSSIWAYLVLGEPLGWRHAVGIGLVVLAIEASRRTEMR
ncbi:MAG TPA: DMT family transporter [Kofleriaceae bacterium]|nr:DMT family transporter [Kofleriaceae bacterium]